MAYSSTACKAVRAALSSTQEKFASRESIRGLMPCLDERTQLLLLLRREKGGFVDLLEINPQADVDCYGGILPGAQFRALAARAGD